MEINEGYGKMDLEISCHNCKYLETDGGDWVDYGSTRVQTPEQSYCVHSITDNMTDEEMDKWNEQEHANCEHWEGK